MIKKYELVKDKLSEVFKLKCGFVKSDKLIIVISNICKKYNLKVLKK